MSSPLVYRPKAEATRYEANSFLTVLYWTDPERWGDDLRWHQRMYRRAQFRWLPEDPVAIALNCVHGRTEFTTPNHLRSLLEGLSILRRFNQHFGYQISRRLNMAEFFTPADSWALGLTCLGLTDDDVEVMAKRFTMHSHVDHPHTEFARALHGFPDPNPFSESWEIMQIQEMYVAAEFVLSDAIADLARELQPRLKLAGLAALAGCEPAELGEWLERQLLERGEPGDPRRMTKDPMRIR